MAKTRVAQIPCHGYGFTQCCSEVRIGLGRTPYWVNTCNVVIGKQQKVVDSGFNEADALTIGHHENKLIVEVGSNTAVPEESFGAH